MAVPNCHAVDGEIVGETTSGVRTDYLVDALGSVTATVSQSAQVQNAYRYKPYGALLAKTGSASDPKSQWVGTLGYRATSRVQSEYDFQSSDYGTATGCWTSVDRSWPETLAYALLRPSRGGGFGRSIDPLIKAIKRYMSCPGAIGSCKGTTYVDCNRLGYIPSRGFEDDKTAQIQALIDQHGHGGSGYAPQGPLAEDAALVTNRRVSGISADLVKCWIYAESGGDAGEIDTPPDARRQGYPTGIVQMRSSNKRNPRPDDLECPSDWFPRPAGGCKLIGAVDLLDEGEGLAFAIYALCNCKHKGRISRTWPVRLTDPNEMAWGTRTRKNSQFCCCMCGIRTGKASC